MRVPGRVAGAHETALQPMAWPLNISAPHVPSSNRYLCKAVNKVEQNKHILLNVRTESLPSEDAHATIAPSSWGAQLTELTA